MADLFISHSTEDIDWARELRRQLDGAGYTCWMAPDDVNGPVPWAEQIRMAIETCRVMLVVISRTANASNHVAKEVAVALELGKPMVPIRTEDVSPTGSLNYLLQLVQWIDAFPGSIADHVPRIRRAVAYSIPTIPQSIAPEGPGPSATGIGAPGPEAPPATPLAPGRSPGTRRRADVAPAGRCERPGLDRRRRRIDARRCVSGLVPDGRGDGHKCDAEPGPIDRARFGVDAVRWARLPRGQSIRCGHGRAVIPGERIFLGRRGDR